MEDRRTDIVLIYIVNNMCTPFASVMYSYPCEARESVMYDVKKYVHTKEGCSEKCKGNQPLNIKTAVEQPILKLGLPNFMWSFYFILLLVASLLFRRILFQRFILVYFRTISETPARRQIGTFKSQTKHQPSFWRQFLWQNDNKNVRTRNKRSTSFKAR